MRYQQTDAGGLWSRVTFLAVLAGLLYASWPLGYWLNPAVAKNGLASGLEALHQPYNWVFITTDIISSLLILLACWLLRRRLGATSQKRLLDLVLLNVVIFAVGTIADTLLPMHCEPSLRHCPSFTVDYFLLFHGVFSIVSAACLFFSLALLWWHNNRDRLLSGLVFGYVLFSLTTLIEIIGWKGGNWSQHYYLTLCGVWLALLPYALHRAFPPSGDVAPPKD
ncbi:MAG TPA: DUF998 domain-containing protein [Candidatus Dormibacteraeota bacterium]|nr:DUF998 domain-containing protein [Candidatus Dormibacteraeota bacterium]